ncbi:MAG: GNAT family N-acetyltransferase [Chitinophagaceae bacterium]
MKKALIHIERANESQIGIIVELSRKTFIETYAEPGNLENLNLYIDSHLTVEQIGLEFAEPKFRFYIAWIEGKPVGFTKIRKDRHPKGISMQKSMEIQRIYVLQEFQGFSVGKELMKMVKELAREEGDQVIWLQVWQKNDKAIQFYRKAGFVVYETASFEFGNEIHNDFLLRFDLYN